MLDGHRVRTRRNTKAFLLALRPTHSSGRVISRSSRCCVENMLTVYFDQAEISFQRMRWEKPSYNDLRFGFEVTMYIYNR